MARMLGHSDARTDNTSRSEVLRRRALVGASALTVDPPVRRLPNIGVSRRRGLTLAIVAVPPTDRDVLVRTWVGLNPLRFRTCVAAEGVRAERPLSRMTAPQHFSSVVAFLRFARDWPHPL